LLFLLNNPNIIHEIAAPQDYDLINAFLFG